MRTRRVHDGTLDAQMVSALTGDLVSTWRKAAIALLLSVGAPGVFACSCSNSTPIQRSVERYRDEAVFKAHVVSLMGRVYNFGGKRESSIVLAEVTERIWGLPWYWPKVVVLDGSYPCDIAVSEGDDLLVAGRRGRYGMLMVNGCTRTQPLQMAQVDLRTLDGSHCAAPGGTVIGRVWRGQDRFSRNSPAPDIDLTFHDQVGKTYSARSDRDGIYELQHLSAGIYTLDSRFSDTQYLAGGYTAPKEGTCGEVGVLLENYDFSGRIPPGLDHHVIVELKKVDDATFWVRANTQGDGAFYFADVPDGEYYLVLEPSSRSGEEDFYFPGTADRRKARHITVANHKVVGANELEFDPNLVPYVPIRVAIDPASGSDRFSSWRVLLVSPNNIVGEEFWTDGARYVTVYGKRGQSYAIRLHGDPNYKLGYDTCTSEDFPVVAQAGMKTVHVPVPSNCR